MTDSYSTTDIYLASALQEQGLLLSRIEKADNKFVFLFEQYFDESKDPIERGIPIAVTADMYWTNGLHCDPKNLFSAFKEIKARMYDVKRSENG